MNTPIWLKEVLEKTEVTDICLNGSGTCFIDRGDGMETLAQESCPWSEEDLRHWALDQISRAGKTWDARHPFVDLTLPSGHRMHAAFPPLARQGILVSLRRSGGLDYRPDRWIDSPLYSQLREIVCRGDSLILSGSTGSGKTTLAGDLLSEVSPRERMLALEDVSELSPRHPHFISLLGRPPNADGFGEVTLRTLLKQALRMRPDRIILGECRGAEVLDLLQCLNTGHRGSLATLHANSPRDALRRIELLCLLASQGAVSPMAIRELLANGIQWVAQVARTAAGRRITELWKIEGREGESILMRPMGIDSSAETMRKPIH